MNSFTNRDDNSLSSLYDNASNSTVQIVSTSPSSPEVPNATEIGAGFVYDNNGDIVTSNHVLQGAKSADIVLKNGDRYLASVIGRDVYTDLAVLGIEGISDNEESGTYSINSYITESSSSFNPSIDGDQQPRQAQTQAQQTQTQ